MIPEKILSQKSKMHDFVNNCLLSVDFKMESRKGTFLSYFAVYCFLLTQKGKKFVCYASLWKIIRYAWRRSLQTTTVLNFTRMSNRSCLTSTFFGRGIVKLPESMEKGNQTKWPNFSRGTCTHKKKRSYFLANPTLLRITLSVVIHSS